MGEQAEANFFVFVLRTVAEGLLCGFVILTLDWGTHRACCRESCRCAEGGAVSLFD